MNKELLRRLKQHRQFIEFIKIKKSKHGIAYKVNKIGNNDKLRRAMFDYFKAWLLKHQLLNKFLFEHELQHRQMLTYNMFEYVNMNLTWADTAQGQEFWNKIDIEWRKHVNYIL